MIRLAGQAAMGLATLLHHAVQIALAMLILVIIAVGSLAMRLSQGPLEIPWIAKRLAAAATADGPTRLTIGHAALAWEGWRLGLDRPLDLRLADIAAIDPAGVVLARLPFAELSVSVGSLLIGRIVPRALEVDGARLRVLRAADGSVSLDLGSLTEGADVQTATSPSPSGAPDAPAGGLSAFLRDLSQPTQGDRSEAAVSRWTQLRRVRIRGAAAVVVDRQLAAIWRAPQLDIDLLRRPGGGVEGEGHADLAIGGQTLGLSLRATLPAAVPGAVAAATTLEAQLTPFVPARFASVSPLLAPLAALDAKVSASATAALGVDLLPLSGAVHVHLDAGRAHINTSTVPFLDADVDARIGGGKLEAALSQLDLAARPDGPHTKITGAVEAHRDGDHFAVGVEIGLDRLMVIDLPTLWPEGVGGPGARPWIVKNITAGTVHDAKFAATLAVPIDLSDANLAGITGGFSGNDLTVTWLAPVPPVEHADGRLAFAGPDEIDITLLSGRQAGGSQGGLTLHGGSVRLTGLAAKHQFADIEADLAGSLPDLLTLLKNPRIKLLDRRPIQMRDPAGALTGVLTVGHLPLENNVTMDDLRIHAVSHLTAVHLGGIAGGQDLDRGALDVDVSNDGLSVKGTATIASIPSQLAVDLDFRDGPPSQVLTKVAASGKADDKALARLGADPSEVLRGTVGLQATLAQRRDGRGDVDVHLDLTQASLAQSRLRIDKPPGSASTGEIRLTLDHDRLASIDYVSLIGKGIDVEGAADIAGGRPDLLRLRRVRLGATTDLHGEIGLPRKPGDAYRVDLVGPSIDVSGEFAGTSKSKGKPAAADDAPGTPYRVDLRFDRVLVANGLSLSSVGAHVENDGRIIRRARIEGWASANAPFSLVVEPAGEGRRLAAEATDLGLLLRAFDLADDVTGGRLSVSGTSDDRRPGHPLSGQLDLDTFRLHGVSVVGKVLQGMTLYGLVDALSGPGLNFNRLVLPFRYVGDVLEIGAARAFSSSLGMTATGSVDLSRRVMDLKGTVVPAYFFNSLLGRIPLVGRILSPEQGGGLFAVTYWARGAFDNPGVGVNPLSALTPGFLRGIFGVFDGAEK